MIACARLIDLTLGVGLIWLAIGFAKSIGLNYLKFNQDFILLESVKVINTKFDNTFVSVFPENNKSFNF